MSRMSACVATHSLQRSQHLERDTWPAHRRDQQGAPRRVAGEHDPPLPLYEQAIIDYFESLLGAGLGGTAYVRS
jgi:hypothetical protein